MPKRKSDAVDGVRVYITIVVTTVIVAINRCVAGRTNASTKAALVVLEIQTATQPMSVAKRLHLWTKLSALRTVSTKSAIPMMTALVGASAVDREGALTEAVGKSAHRIPNVIWTNIVARRRHGEAIGIGEIQLTVLKPVLASFAELTRTVEAEMSVVFLINVLIVAVLDVPQNQTAVLAIIVVNDSGMAVNLASVVRAAVLENFVVQSMTVVARAKRVTRTVDVQFYLKNAVVSGTVALGNIVVRKEICMAV